MSLSLTRLEWIDAPVAPHALADAIAAAARPRDLAPPPSKSEGAQIPAALRARTLSMVVAAHAAILLAGAFAWRASLPTPEAIEEIPVEIVVEGADAMREPALVDAPAPPPPVAAMQDSAATDAADAQPPQQAATEAPAQRQAEDDDAASHLQATAPADQAITPEQSARAVKPAPSAEAARAAEIEQERREAAARRRAEARAARLAEERAEVERERRAQAKRAAERERQAQAAQERRRIAARSMAAEPARPAASAFDAAAYRSIVARAVASSASRSCPAGGGGRVVVALMIAPSGRVASASLSSASGNSVLDAAALAAVRRAGPFPAPSNRASVSVPVVVVCR
ncbi:MAG: TonB family protein [Rhodoblastus sp.]